MGLILAFRGGASVGRRARLRAPYVFPSSLEAASRQREEVSSAYMLSHRICTRRHEGKAGRPMFVLPPGPLALGH